MCDETTTQMNSQPHRWFAIQTRSRHEKVVRSQLEMRNVEILAADDEASKSVDR